MSNRIIRTLEYTLFDENGDDTGLTFDYKVEINKETAKSFFHEYFSYQYDNSNADEKKGFDRAILPMFENGLLDTFFDGEDDGTPDYEYVNEWLKNYFFEDAEKECESVYDEEEDYALYRREQPDYSDDRD